jgi:hypothetical protein
MEVLRLAFQFKRNCKFALFVLDGVYSSLPDSEFQLLDGTWVMPRVPSVADLDLWTKWVGTIRMEALQRANLVLLAEEESSNPILLDETHHRLNLRLCQLFYYLHLRQGIEYGGEADVISGSCREGNPIIRQMNKLPTFHQSKGYTRAPITVEWMQEAFALSSEANAIGLSNGEFQRLIRGLNILFEGLKARGQERLHQFARSLEALILPDKGRTTNQFAHRCQIFAVAGPVARTALHEVFDMRSDTEHLQDWNRAVQKYAASERENVCWQRTRQIERLACFAYSRLLLDANLRAHFRTDDTLAQFWKLRDNERRAIWGKSLDIAKEPLFTTFDQWGRGVSV